jgi:predicted dinucleotide-binding enzyme
MLCNMTFDTLQLSERTRGPMFCSAPRPTGQGRHEGASMKITFIGSGQVGGALADRLERQGHRVTLAARDPNSSSVRESLARNPRLLVQAPAAAVAEADLVFLATPYAANQQVLTELKDALRGKVLVDCTNPVGPGLRHGLKSVQSGSEVVQALVPEARVVKAFSIYGYENFADPNYPGYSVRPALLFCGADEVAKAQVGALIDTLGFEPIDVGGLEQALHLEHLTLLWVRMIRAGQRSPHLVWAALQRS